MVSIALLYHRIEDRAREVRDPLDITVSLDNFEEQLEVLRGVSEILPLSEWLTATFDPARTACLITFDDGYRATLAHAAPALARAGAPAVIFVCPGHIGMDRPFWWDRLSMLETGEGAPGADSFSARAVARGLMGLRYSTADEIVAMLASDPRDRGTPLRREHEVVTWDDLSRLDGTLFTIAHHGFHHSAFSALEGPELARSFRQSHAAFAEAGIAVAPVVSYPFGFPASVTRTQIRECVAAHFSAAFTTIRAPVDLSAAGRYTIPRHYVGNWTGEVFRKWLAKLLHPATQ